MKSRHPLVVQTLRGPVVESLHHVMAVVADKRGVLSRFWGNHDYVTYPRSSIKPLQALPFVMSGAMEKFSLGPEHLALACASHHAEEIHEKILREWLKKIGQAESILHCGPAKAKGKPDAGATPLFHNCSGKHLGFISTALAMGEDPRGYEKYEHPVQVRIRKILSELSKIDYAKMPWGVDGCGIPTYAVPLISIAQMGAAVFGEIPQMVRYHRASEQVMAAMAAHPILVAGEADFATAVMQKTAGRVLVKPGAEGVSMAWIRPEMQCVILKVQDGNAKAATVAMGWVLRQLGAISDSEAKELASELHPLVLNSRNIEIGEMRVEMRG